MGQNEKGILSEYRDREYGDKILPKAALVRMSDSARDHVDTELLVRRRPRIRYKILSLLIATALIIVVVRPDWAMAFISNLGFNVWKTSAPESYVGSWWLSSSELDYLGSEYNQDSGIIETRYNYGNAAVTTFEMSRVQFDSFGNYKDTADGKRAFIRMNGSIQCEYWYDETGSYAVLTHDELVLTVSTDSIPESRYIEILKSVQKL